MTSQPAAVPVPRQARRLEVYAVVHAPDGSPRLAGGRPGDAAEGPGPRVPGAVLGHGEQPRAAAARALASHPELAADLDLGTDPFRLVAVHSDVRTGAGGPPVHVLRFVLVAGGGRAAPAPEPHLLHHPRPPLAAARAPGGPPQVQRPAAYAVVVRDGEVLLTRVTGVGVWSLPGGGIDHGEHPDDAVRREVLEEAGLELTRVALLDVDGRHFTGRGPDRVLEDFHGVRVLYRGEVAGRGEPHVREVGGSTDAAAWFPLRHLDGLRLTDVVRAGLQRVG